MKLNRRPGESRGPVFFFKLKTWIPAFAGMTALILFFSELAADELFLKEGKILHGKITKEDKTEYTILLASNMYLRVTKDKVSHVVRTPRKERTIVRLETQTKMSKTAISTAAATPPPPTFISPKLGIDRETFNHGVASMERVLLTESWNRPQKNARPPRPQWKVQWTGTTEQEEAQSKWKTISFISTITVLLPTPPHVSKPSPAEVENWNRIFTQDVIYVTGAVKMITGSLESFAQQLTLLRAPDDKTLWDQTARLFEDSKDKTKKRLDGYDRRNKNLFDKPPK